MKTGIYMILNITNDKKYVGSSCDIKMRWKKHKQSLNNNKHHNQYLQNSWNKYGSENFKFIILEETSSDQLQDREAYWCDCFKSHSKGYNIAAIIRGGFVSEDFRLSQSEKCTNKKKIWLTSTKGTILNTFESVTEASRILNTPISNVTFLINGTSQVFNKEFMLWDSLSFTNSSIDKRLSSRNRSNSHSMKMVYKFSIDNVLIESYQSLKQAISNNPLISGISDCVKNKRSSGSCEAGGYFWTYCSEGPQSLTLNNGKILKVYQYSIDKQTLINEYPSTAIAASLTNSKVKGIQKVISGTRNSHNGFFWSRTKLMD